MTKFERPKCRKLKELVVSVPRNYWFLIIVNKRRLGSGPKTALSIDRDCDPAEKVNVLSATRVRLYRAIAPLYKAFACAIRIAGEGLTRMSYNVASINLNCAFAGFFFF